MIGGDNVKDTVKLVMNRLFTNYVMSFLGLDGGSYGKIAFRNSPICQVVMRSYVEHICLYQIAGRVE